jgi:hypothetical protein
MFGTIEFFMFLCFSGEISTLQIGPQLGCHSPSDALLFPCCKHRVLELALEIYRDILPYITSITKHKRILRYGVLVNYID